MSSILLPQLLQKYDVPVPRYTSYPTVPYWGEPPTENQWLSAMEESLAPSQAAWSLYLHIPFCESLCTFCGCNTSITKDHAKGLPYVDSLLKEWSYYRERFPALAERPLRHVHLGGGTPTFLAADELKRLLEPLLEAARFDPARAQGSIEIDPRRTNREQLRTLRELGFHRVSLGVQDFDGEVQRLVNRFQPEAETRAITEMARELGYESVNYDLIYGLPKQTAASFGHSVEKTLALRPDRIALYSFALVPWIKPAQRLFKDEDLPRGADKRSLYEQARSAFLSAGYVEIGMDHFALADEPLAKALQNGGLHRNFMGYTEFRTDLLLGLGVSSISETRSAFHQNEKVLPLWDQKVRAGELPTHRGHLLTESDKRQREQILRFMTLGSVQLSAEEREDALSFLAPMLADDLVRIEGNEMRITEAGRPFLRNACALFDLRLRHAQPAARIFSQSI